VTLEPCAHHGRTGPCAVALAKAGLARVVVAIEDPDPRVSGQGLVILRAAGITVELGEGADQARRDMAGFLSRIVRRRPYVTLKLALSADQKIAARPGEETAITGPEARARVHLLRAQNDAILVGMGTVRADDPELTCRLSGLDSRSPKPFVLGHGPLRPSSKLAARGAEIVAGPLLPILESMAARGINRLMVEGGARTARAFLEAGLVDEFQLYQAPAKLGPEAVDALAGLSLRDALQPFILREQETLGADHLSVYERAVLFNSSP
jgi:diaminohydroxyphosphoribosylaminopyrimidine deaminase/5-amino-6-(5-phosphoribosylamino)uracil reductase